MRKLLRFMGVWLFVANVTAQTPAVYKKIHFTYERKTNYIIRDEGVYADTILLKIQFPKLKFSKVTNPEHENEVFGFIPFSSFVNEDRRKLIGSLYHANETLEGTYDVQKNRTKIKAVRNDKATREIFKKYFDEGYSPFKYTIVIDYDKKRIIHDFPLKSYEQDFFTAAKKITFSDDAGLSGMFEQKNQVMEMQNVVILENKLDQKITPGYIFTNNKYGVHKIWSIFETLTLTSTRYEQ